jgi:hypothetical protein
MSGKKYLIEKQKKMTQKSNPKGKKSQEKKKERNSTTANDKNGRD